MLHKVASVLLLVGGLNWGIWGAFETNVVEMVLQNGTLITIVYILVGLSALYEIARRLKSS